MIPCWLLSEMEGDRRAAVIFADSEEEALQKVTRILRSWKRDGAYFVRARVVTESEDLRRRCLDLAGELAVRGHTVTAGDLEEVARLIGGRVVP